jgi:hypothetical protein
VSSRASGLPLDDARTARGLLAGAVAVLALGSCIRQADRAPAASVETIGAQEQVARGGTLFSGRCTKCHGRNGEGSSDVPAVLGPLALPEFVRDDSVASSFAIHDLEQLQIQQQTRSVGASPRGPFRTAQDLYDYLTVHRVEGRPALKSDDYWALVAFMLLAHGNELPAEGIGPANAGLTSIRRQ